MSEQTATAIHADQVLDVKGLACPLPILKTKQFLNKMPAGEVLHILATDPASPIDFKAFCLRTEHELVHAVETEELCEFYIRKA